MNIKDYGKKIKGKGGWANASITMILITLVIGSKTKDTDMVPSSTSTTKSDTLVTGGMICAMVRVF